MTDFSHQNDNQNLLGSESNNDFYLSDVSPKDKLWDKHKLEAIKLAALYLDSEFFIKYGERTRNCVQSLLFAFQANDQGETFLRLHAASFCRVRHCPVCQWRRSLMWRSRFLQGLEQLLLDYPSSKFIFLTLTVKNCEINQLKATLNQMNSAWKRLIQRKSWPAEGFVRSTEITRSKIGEAHPHFHCLFQVPASYFSGGYISQVEWTNLWKSCLKVEYTPVVNVKRVKTTGSALPPENLKKAVCETLKYSVKESDLIADGQWLYELTTQLHNTRAVALGGVFRDYFSDNEPEDLIHVEPNEEEELEIASPQKVLFNWKSSVKRYIKK